MKIKDGRMTINRTRKIQWSYINNDFVKYKVRFVNWLKARKICKRGAGNWNG